MLLLYLLQFLCALIEIEVQFLIYNVLKTFIITTAVILKRLIVNFLEHLAGTETHPISNQPCVLP